MAHFRSKYYVVSRPCMGERIANTHETFAAQFCNKYKQLDPYVTSLG
jgi:hypothetical protein